MKSYFLSYAHSDSRLADIVERIFKRHGVRIWRDKRNLAPGCRFADAIQKAINERCDGLIIIVTPQSLTSGFISNIELLEAHHSQLPIIPLFFGVSIKEIKRLSPQTIGFDLTSFQGANELPSPESEDEASIQQKVDEVAWKTLRESLRQLKSARPGKSLRVALHSYSHVLDKDVDIDLDWTEYFQDALPNSQVWNDVLLPALTRVKRAIMGSGLTTPELFLPFGVHLSIGLAFGFVFRQQTRFQLAIQQGPQIWHTRIAPSSRETVPKLTYDRKEADVDDPRSHDMALGLSFSRDLRNSLDQMVGVRLKRNIVPPDGPGRHSVPDGKHALWWAHEIADRIGKLQAKHRIETTHLYFSMPFGMAVMLGWFLNARGPIQVHEWDKKTGDYQSACRLRG